jgi:hypothetical protein
MRRFLLIASAAMIALIGLSANQCSGGKEDKAEPEAPAAKPDDSGNMGSDSNNKGSDSGNMGSDSDTGETPSE